MQDFLWAAYAFKAKVTKQWKQTNRPATVSVAQTLLKSSLEVSYHLISHPDPDVTPKLAPMPTFHIRLHERHKQTQANKIFQRLILVHKQETLKTFCKGLATGPRRKQLVCLRFEFDHSNFLSVNWEQAHFEIFKDNVGLISIKFYLSIEYCC